MHLNRKLSHLFFVFCLAALTVGSLGGCASLLVRARDSTLPIHTQASSIGRIQVCAWESDSHLYVSGTFRKAFGIHHPYNLRVRVVLEDAGGGVLKSEEERIPPTNPRKGASGWGSHSFVIKFPLREISEAKSIRVMLQQGAQL